MPEHDRDGDAASRTQGLTVVILAAVAENGVIGAEGEIPWDYPADLAHFKETTMGHPVIMGRRTYESITQRLGGPLPGRTNVVLSRSGFGPDGTGSAAEETSVRVVESIEAALAAAAETGAEVAYVAGGASVYGQFLPLADRLLITEVPASPAGDTHFPDWDAEAWDVRERRTEGDLAFVTYERSAEAE